MSWEPKLTRVPEKHICRRCGGKKIIGINKIRKCPRCKGKGFVTDKNWKNPRSSGKNPYADKHGNLLTELLHGMDNLIEDYATAAGTSGGAKKGWLTRQHGPDIATRKKHGKFSKWLHEWAKDYANTLQLDDDFVKKHPEDWIQQSYKQAYRLARKKFF